MMAKKWLLTGLSVATFTLSEPALFAAAPPTSTKPDVLFLIVDDLRTEFGAYGADYIHSPNLDRLAKRSLTFNRAYCQQAVCSPSRSSLLTGTRPDTTKVWDLQTHFRKALPDVVTLPQDFKQNGYFVQGFGKIYHGGLDDPRSWSVPLTRAMSGGQYALKENTAITKRRAEESKQERPEGEGTYSSKLGPAFECADVPDNTYQDGKIADLAITALREIAKKNQPFWLGIGFLKPHLPFVAPKKYWDLYDPAKIALAPNPFPPKGAPTYAVELTGGELRTYAGIPAVGPIPDDLARQLKHGYYAAISYTDALLGRVLDELDRLGLADNTIIILWGDNGWKLGEHAGWTKHTNMENDTRIPLLISVPGMKTAGQKTDSLVELVDVYPTLTELCGLPLLKHLEGTSLVPILHDSKATVSPVALSQYPRRLKDKQLMGYSMCTDRYRFTVWVDRKDHSVIDAIELYDHQVDPQENVSIAKDPANAELVKQLMRQWTKSWQGMKPPVAQE